MGAFEYLSVLISIILASGITRVLAGVGEMFRERPLPFHNCSVPTSMTQTHPQLNDVEWNRYKDFSADR
jgi:hypothetical protein